MRSFYSGDPTKNVLWDLNDVTEINISKEEVQKIANFQPRYRSTRPHEGKTAIVASKPSYYGLSRMFEIYSNLKNVPFQVSIFHTIEEADRWLDA
jgi:hypothetical protein